MLEAQATTNASWSPLALNQDPYELLQHGIVKATESPFKAGFAFLFPFVAIWFLWNVYLDRKLIPGFPVAGQTGAWDVFRIVARWRYLNYGDDVIMEGKKKYGEDAFFQVTGHSEPYLYVPIQYMKELRNSEDLSMQESIIRDFFGTYKPFHSTAKSIQSNLLVQTLQKKLTPMLGLTIGPVDDETKMGVLKYWPPTTEWKEHSFPEQIKRLVAQVSSRVFIGEPICRDEEWIDLAKDYTFDLMIASFSMQYMPRQLRPLLYRFIPPVHKLTSTVAKARTFIEPEVQRRKKIAADALARGEKLPKHVDAIQWMTELAGESSYDVTAGQLILIFGAVVSTSTTVTHLLYDIIQYGLVDELRQEIINVFREEDSKWTTNSLYKLKLLDSVMRESSRLHNLSPISIHRYTTKPVELSNGTRIPKGTRLITPNHHHLSNDYYENADKFDGKRFLKLREQPGNTNKYQYVTATPDYTFFGLGMHACPGRFFASNEIKIIMAHLLIQYDWKFVNDERPTKTLAGGGANFADGPTPILYKSRAPEVDL